MSAERCTLRRAPSGARIHDGTLDTFVAALVESERAKARADGVAAGANAALQAAASKLAAAAERLDADREAARAKLSSSAVALALAIARGVVRAEIAAGRHDVERIVREVLASAGIGRGPCQVHVHPSDAARLSEATFRAGTTLVPDVGVARGDVQIETPQGLLVHDVDEALARIASRLEQELA